MPAFIDTFTMDFGRTTKKHYTETYHVTEVDYQRNGVSGEGFFIVALHKPQPSPTDDSIIIGFKMLRAVVFEGLPKACAVFDPNRLDDHYRGDNFEPGLRQVINRWEASR